MYKSIRRYFVEKINYFKYYSYLPSNYKSTDLYIVEFPKSGITWFSTIVSNLNLIESSLNQRATFFNIQQLIPDIHVSRIIPDMPMWNIPSYRFIKSHHPYCPLYFNTIYLVRNPISVMDSYYRYSIEREAYSGSFSDFVKHPKYGIDSWVSHVDGWLNKSNYQRMHVIKYEDLKDNPLETIKDLYLNLGLQCSHESLSEAINLSSLTNMKACEKLYKSYDLSREVAFVGSGEKKVAIIDDNVKSYILSRSAHLLVALDYSSEDL